MWEKASYVVKVNQSQLASSFVRSFLAGFPLPIAPLSLFLVLLPLLDSQPVPVVGAASNSTFN